MRTRFRGDPSAYDLNSPGQDYDSLIEEIKSLGDWAKIQKSLWYVNSTLTASEAVDRLWKGMDRNDSLIVVDANHNSAAWQGVDGKVGDFIKQRWNQ